MNTVKTFTVGINPINEGNTFTSGDTITGQVTLELSSDCKIDLLHVKLKGKAQVKWTENYGKTSVTYHNKEKYFSMTQQLLTDVHSNFGPGFKIYPFSFTIPSQELPSSLKASYGKIVYSAEAILNRPMRLDSKAKAEFTVLHRGNTGSDASLAVLQHGMIEKKMNLFTSGTVGMDVNIDRSSYQPGEGIKVVASILNRSSRDIRPKYCLYSKYSYFAKNKRKVQTKDILKEVGEIVPPSAGVTISRIITIPPEMGASILNCSILKAEYRLRVYLDVKYALDPQIKFPIVILSTSEDAVNGEEQEYGFDRFAESGFTSGISFPENQTATGPSVPPPSYAALYPTLTGTGGKH